MMMILFFMSIIYIESIFGMDDLSNTPSSTTEEIDWDEYIKQESEINDLHEDYKMIAYDETNYFNENEFQKENCDIENLIAESEEDLNEPNELKRKHKSNKIPVCEFCQEESKQYKKSKLNGKSLCNACYLYERKNGYLIPKDQRNKLRKHTDILVCEFCQQESTQYVTSKLTSKSLCQNCYNYESRHGHLIPTDKRKKRALPNILGCEFCQKETKEYTRGKISDKVLCHACYQYEYSNGHLISFDNRKRRGHKNILVCEFCQKEDIRYKKGKFNGKSLCNACYQYERKHGHLIPQDQRNEFVKHKDILVCDFCKKESTRYVTSKSSGKPLCKNCYKYESRHGHLVPTVERKKRKKHKNKNNQLNRLIDTELSYNENEGKIQEKTINPTHITKQKNKDTLIRYDDN